jgi:uncharacterized protein (DUF1697 family)
MPRWIAFLRAINVGGRTVRMDRLRALFEEIGYAEVETFIASGNVIFDSPRSEAQALEQAIEAHLKTALGYDVTTFIRNLTELAAIAAYSPFPPKETGAAATYLYVQLLKAAPEPAAQERVLALQTPVDAFHFNGRELYWLRRGMISQSQISGGLLEKTLKMPGTMRNTTTIRKMAAKYPPGLR